MEFYIFLAFLCMVLFGVNAILYKVAPNIDSATLTLVSFTTSAVGTFVYWLFFVKNKHFSWNGAAVGMIAGMSSVIALFAFISALKLGKASTVNTIRALSAAVTVVLAVVFLREDLQLVHWCGILLGIIAAVILSF